MRACVFLLKIIPLSLQQSSSESDLSEVHGDQALIKQGYLIKQGRRVRNWKRRLFTLSSACLAYRELEVSSGFFCVFFKHF